MFKLYVASNDSIKSIANESVRLINKFSQPEYNISVQEQIDRVKIEQPNKLIRSIYLEQIGKVVFSLNHEHPTGKLLDEAIKEDKTSKLQYEPEDNWYTTLLSDKLEQFPTETKPSNTEDNQQAYRGKLRKRTQRTENHE